MLTGIEIGCIGLFMIITVYMMVSINLYVYSINKKLKRLIDNITSKGEES